MSLYHTHFGNLQVSTFEGTNVVVVNAADARSQGFEADMQWLLPVKGLSLGLRLRPVADVPDLR